MLSECPGKKAIFKELRVRFVIFRIFFIGNNFASEGNEAVKYSPPNVFSM